MKRRSILLTLLLTPGLLCLPAALWAPSSQAREDGIVVIVNKANPASVLEVTDLRPIFQTRKTSWGSGLDAVPINLPENNALRIAFDQTVLGLNAERVARYWQDRKIRGGARPPVRVPSSAAMLRAVAAKAGAVGYVKASEVDATVKVVAKILGGKLSGP
jgi:ABC-type phosphate transport system substrate-binding protein